MQELCQLSSTVSDVIKDKFYEALPYTILCRVETSAVSMLHKKKSIVYHQRTSYTGHKY